MSEIIKNLTKIRLIFLTTICFFGLCLSIYSTYFIYDYLYDKSRIRIERNFEERAEKLQLNINYNLQTLTSLSALFYSNDYVSKKMFKSFNAVNLEKNNSIISLAWIPVIDHKNRTKFEMNLSGKGARGNHIYDINHHGLVSIALNSSFYYPVEYLYSKRRTQLFPGLNLGTQYKTRKRLDEAARRMNILITDGMIIRSHNPVTVIVRAFKPVPNELDNMTDSVKGFVMAEIDIENLMQTINDSEDPFSILLFDLEKKDHSQVLYRNNKATLSNGDIYNINDLSSADSLHWTRYYNIGNKKWMIAFIDNESKNYLIVLPFLVMISMLLLTLLICIYVINFWEKSRQVIKLKLESDSKSRYLQAIGHDLRQPLNIINLYLNKIEEKISNNALEPLIYNMRNSIFGLHKMFTSLLDISKLESNLIEIDDSNVKLLPLFTDLEDEFDLLASEKNVEFIMRCQDITIKTDPILLERCIRNLLENSIKYTEKGKILLAARKVKTNIYIYVIDTGIGIPDDEIKIIQEPYTRGSATTKIDGLGLGLAIVKQTLKILNINMIIQSTPNKGTAITLMKN